MIEGLSPQQKWNRANPEAMRGHNAVFLARKAATLSQLASRYAARPLSIITTTTVDP